jgi:hypothetical protein
MSIIVFGLITCAVLFSSILNAEMYSWTDENGVRHFGNVPPPSDAADVKTMAEINSSDEHKLERKRLQHEQSMREPEIKLQEEMNQELEKDSRLQELKANKVDRYFKEANEYMAKDDYGSRQVAKLLRAIGASYANCPGTDIDKASKCYRDAETEMKKIRRCRHPIGYRAPKGSTYGVINDHSNDCVWDGNCTSPILRKAIQFRKMGDIYMGCSADR